MNKLQELIEAKIEILSEDKTKDVMSVIVPFIQSDIKNKNGRIYPKSLLQREVARVQGSVKKGSFIGVGDHPVSGIENIATASHIVTKLSLDEKGKGTAELRILPTERGKAIQTLIRNDATLGVSIRGFGTISKDGRVADDYKLAGLDVVMNPSFKDSVFDKSNIFESANFNEDKKMKDMMGLEESYVQEMMEDCYKLFVKNEGFKGSFSDFEKQWGDAFLAEILVSEGKCKTTEEALKHLGVDKDFEKQSPALDKKTYLGACDMGYHGTQEEFEDMIGGLGGKKLTETQAETQVGARLYSYFCEALAAGYQGDYMAWKSEFPAIVEMAKEVKVVVEKKVENKVPFSSKTTWNEVVASGFTGTQKEFEEQYPDITVTKLAVEKPIVESLDQEAKRIFYELKKDNPNSSLQLEDVEKMLEKEEAPKREKKTRELAIYRVNRSIAGSGDIPSSAILEKMVDDEVRSIKEEREEKKRKNWQAYKRLLSD